jgi:hypothetical protein
MQRPFPNGQNFPFGCNGYVTAVAAGQSQRVYSGVGIFNWGIISVRLLRSCVSRWSTSPRIKVADIYILYRYRTSWLVYIYQSPSFKGEPGGPWDLRRRTEIIPVKDSHTRINPLALASGHGRYITVTPERKILSVGEWPLHII